MVHGEVSGPPHWSGRLLADQVEVGAEAMPHVIGTEAGRAEHAPRGRRIGDTGQVEVAARLGHRRDPGAVSVPPAGRYAVITADVEHQVEAAVHARLAQPGDIAHDEGGRGAGRGRPRAGDLDGAGREIHPDRLPAQAGEVQHVASGSAAQVEHPARRTAPGQLSEFGLWFGAVPAGCSGAVGEPVEEGANHHPHLP